MPDIYRARAALSARMDRIYRAKTIQTAALLVFLPLITTELNKRSFGSYVILGRVSAANTAGASETGGTILGVSSERGTLNLQTSPVEAKMAFMFPPNCSSARKNRRVPKPR
jgi:hypothetical protein